MRFAFMPSPSSGNAAFSWRLLGAVFFFSCGLAGFASGVIVSERPDVGTADLLSQAYYSLSLFVIGGVELGTPVAGPLYGRLLLWLAYFGSPVLAAWTLIEALLKSLSPQQFQLRKLRDHVVVIGAGELTLSYLRVLRSHNPRVPVVVVSRAPPLPTVIDELREEYDAMVVVGDVTHEFFLRQLRVKRAQRIMLLSDNSLRSYEAVSTILNLVPGIGPRIVMHCANLRFMRSMQATRVAQSCETFNSYNLASYGLVHGHMLHRFEKSKGKDIVVLAGFGRFGQTLLEELQRHAQGELDTVAIIEKDAVRRVLVAEEQMTFSDDYRRQVYEGDISHPAVWQRLREDIHIPQDAYNLIFVLGTGHEEDNLRTALWLRRNFPNAMVIARSSKQSRFAEEVGAEHNIISVSIHELVEDNIPKQWVDL
ncbi:NAD-binding protein [Kineobactrum sediminis]|nr:NAD-binding protein [Kineobactrum sediminis]